MNENRGVFVLDGVTGMLIATVLLITILVGLTYAGITAQQRNANNYYEIKDAGSIKMIDTATVAHRVNVK